MERVVSLVKNKFLIAGVAFLGWMCFFDRYDFATQYSYQKERNKLQYEKEFYTSEIDNLEKSIKDAQYNPSEIQRIAREKYKMKKDNEDIYVISEINSSKK
jgi:cell division protein FtsB